MLPFLQPKKAAATIISTRRSDGTSEAPDMEEGEHHPELMKHAESLINGIHAKDSNRVAEAMQNIHNHLNPKELKDASDKEQI